LGTNLCSIYSIGSLSDPATLAPTPNTGYLIINIFYNATNSLAATNFMMFIILFNNTAGCIASLAAASRQLWAFARNGGTPFSSVFAPVRVLFFMFYIG
jgi:choline transport protein